jgi:serine/threonine-protein kinase
MTARPDPRVGSELGPYRIERVIGRGGMGVVYLATHTVMQRRVALKLLAPEYAEDAAFRARFLRESRLAAAIDHPNIIPIYEAGEIAGTYVLAMRFVEGTDLQARLTTGPLAPREVVHILGQVASALDAAHAAGLVHRDVKPANMLLAPGQGADRADHAYLTDFGLTKQRGTESDLTRAGSFLGTVDYIAPEQIEGKPVDGRADQYSLAAIAVAALSGEVPFPRDSDVAVINAHLRDDPPSLHERRPELPAAVDAVVRRGMAKRPADRYPECRAFVDDLRAALGVTDTDLHRRPPASSRRRGILAAVGLGAAVVVTVLALALGSGWPGPLATQSPSPSAAAQASTSAEPTASPSTGAFPTVEEQALLDRLAAVPGEFTATCVRGPYVTVPPALVPRASLECSPDIATGASQVVVRQFDLLHYTVKSVFATYPFVDLPLGDCARESPAIGSWSLAGEVRGTVACYTDEATGDALLYWTYDQDEILVRARNARGDSEALYDFFDTHAKFIAP